MRTMNPMHKDTQIGKTIYGTMKTAETIANSASAPITSDVVLSPGIWAIELQIDGFTSTAGKWAAIAINGQRDIASLSLYGLLGTRITAILPTAAEITCYGNLINYGGANSYTPHFTDYFKATLIGSI